MPLSEQQRLALRTLDWVYDHDARRSGRTYALVLGAIRAACRFPGHRIRILDHHPPPTSGRIDLIEIVSRLVNSDHRLRPHLRTWAGPEISFDMTRPILNWLPRDENLPEVLPMVSDAHREEIMAEFAEPANVMHLDAAILRWNEAEQPLLTMDSISQETVGRHREEARLAIKNPKPRPKKPKPVVRTVLDRLLAEDDDY